MRRGGEAAAGGRLGVTPLLSRDAIVRGLVSEYGVTRPVAEQKADQIIAKRGPEPARPRTTTSRQTDPALTAPIVAHRVDDTLRLVIETPPRTKKNGRKGGYFGLSTKNTPYAKYERELIDAIDTVREQLALPLPDQPYNIAVLYVVDRYGERADRPGLDQGLFDALQKAGVVTNDWLFRSTEGTRIAVAGDAGRPRLELTITPLDVPAVPTPT